MTRQEAGAAARGQLPAPVRSWPAAGGQDFVHLAQLLGEFRGHRVETIVALPCTLRLCTFAPAARASPCSDLSKGASCVALRHWDAYRRTRRRGAGSSNYSSQLPHSQDSARGAVMDCQDILRRPLRAGVQAARCGRSGAPRSASPWRCSWRPSRWRVPASAAPSPTWTSTAPTSRSAAPTCRPSSRSAARPEPCSPSLHEDLARAAQKPCSPSLREGLVHAAQNPALRACVRLQVQDLVGTSQECHTAGSDTGRLRMHAWAQRPRGCAGSRRSVRRRSRRRQPRARRRRRRSSRGRGAPEPPRAATPFLCMYSVFGVSILGCP